MLNTQGFAQAVETDPAIKEQIGTTLQAIFDRSATDHAFRLKLLADSRTALAEFAGVEVEKIPAGAIRFAERTAETPILLPPFTGSQELTEGDLETVAGGTDPFTIAAILVIGVDVGIAAGIALYEIKH